MLRERRSTVIAKSWKIESKKDEVMACAYSSSSSSSSAPFCFVSNGRSGT